MSAPMYHLVGQPGGVRTLTVFVDGDAPLTIHDDHPNFDEVLSGLQDDSLDGQGVLDLADLERVVSLNLTPLSERVAVGNGRVYFDGDEVDSSVAKLIVRCLDQGLPAAARPLVKFMENIAANPNDHSRVQLFDWLAVRDFTIDVDGNVVAYKGVHDGPRPGTFQSGFAGRALVNGEQQNGNIVQAEGDTVEMPRSEVQHDPGAACSTGLHVGTFEYARAYANGALLRVKVNPRDVVSVPTDAAGEKVRVSRYRIEEVIDAPDTRAVAFPSEDGGLEPTDLDESDWCDLCEDYH